MCDYYVEMMCAGRFGLSWAHDVFTVAYHMLRHTYLYFFIFLYWSIWCFSVCPFLSLFLLLVALWHLNKNLLRPGTRQVILSNFFDTNLPSVIYNRGLGVTVWHLGHLSLRDHTRVLLQYAWIWLYSTSFYHSHSRYAHRNHSRSYIQGATCLEGKVCWLPRLWASEDCVQRRALVSLL